MVSSRLRRRSPPYISPSPSPSPSPRPFSREPEPISVFSADWDLEVAIMANSRPSGSPQLQQVPIPPSSPPSAVPPTLAEVLANTSPVPWTLAAFMAYLSQNHCLETLEFTMDAQRYKAAYEQTQACSGYGVDGNDHLCSLWEKLVQAYIVPCAPREINIPSYVRERLLNLSPSSLPPAPEELQEAVESVEELMNDSVFLPFLESVSSSSPATGTVSSPATSLTRSAGRAILRMPKHKSGSSSGSQSSGSPGFFHDHFHHHNHHHHHLLHLRSPSDSPSDSSTSPETPDRDLYFDDSTSVGSPATLDPMSPPMTPPTPDSPSGSFQRVVAAHTSAWKKVKLGFKKKPKPSSSAAMASSYSAGDDPAMTDPSNGPADPMAMSFDGTSYADGTFAPFPHPPHCQYDR